MSVRRFPTPRREATLLVSADFLVDLCKGGGLRRARVLANALPGDATIVRIAVDPESGWLRLVVASATFPLVAFGAPLPELRTPLFEVAGAEELVAEARRRADAVDGVWPDDEAAADADLLRRLADALEH